MKNILIILFSLFFSAYVFISGKVDRYEPPKTAEIFSWPAMNAMKGVNGFSVDVLEMDGHRVDSDIVIRASKKSGGIIEKCGFRTDYRSLTIKVLSNYPLCPITHFLRIGIGQYRMMGISLDKYQIIIQSVDYGNIGMITK